MSFIDSLINGFKGLAVIVAIVGGIYVSLILLLVVVGAVGGIAMNLSFATFASNATINNTMNSFITLVATLTGNVASLIGFVVLAVLLTLFGPMIKQKFDKKKETSKYGGNVGGGAII